MILFLSKEEGHILGDVYIVILSYCNIDSCDIVVLYELHKEGSQVDTLVYPLH